MADPNILRTGGQTRYDGQTHIAFQIPDELFEQFKQYLKKHGLKQNAFLLGCIQQALDEDAQDETHCEHE